MEKTLLSVKVDKNLRESARNVAKDLGLPLGTIINSYLRRLVDERTVVFTSHPMPSKKTQELLAEIDKDIKNKKNLCGSFDGAESAIKFLKS